MKNRKIRTFIVLVKEQYVIQHIVLYFNECYIQRF